MKTKTINTLDKIGTSLSLVCLIHCLLLPILLATIPFISFLSFLQTPLAEAFMIIFAIINAVIAVTQGFKMHKNYIVVTFLFSGTALILLNLWLHSHSHVGEIFAPIGAFILGAGHIINKRLCGQCKKCNHE